MRGKWSGLPHKWTQMNMWWWAGDGSGRGRSCTSALQGRHLPLVSGNEKKVVSQFGPDRIHRMSEGYEFSHKLVPVHKGWEAERWSGVHTGLKSEGLFYFENWLVSRWCSWLPVWLDVLCEEWCGWSKLQPGSAPHPRFSLSPCPILSLSFLEICSEVVT